MHLEFLTLKNTRKIGISFFQNQQLLASTIMENNENKPMQKKKMCEPSQQYNNKI